MSENVELYQHFKMTALYFIHECPIILLARDLLLGIFWGRGRFWLRQTTLYIHIVNVSHYVVRKNNAQMTNRCANSARLDSKKLTILYARQGGRRMNACLPRPLATHVLAVFYLVVISSSPVLLLVV